MDILQIDNIVRDFPSGKGRNSSITNPKLLTVAALLATAALLLLLLQRAGNEPPRMATAFPVIETEATGKTPPEQLKVMSGVPVKTSLAEPDILVSEPTSNDEADAASPTPITPPAPAAAPTTAATAPERLSPAAGQHNTSKKSSPKATGEYMPPFGETTISGSYELSGNKILLETTERVNGRKITWMLPVKTSGEEQRLLFLRGASTGYLERETGRLILMKNQGDQAGGTFSFQPHIQTRKAYEKAGLGTDDVPAELIKLSGMQQGASLAPEVYTRQPAEILWLRYFTLGIDQEYLDLLRQMGYDNEDFSGNHHENGHGENSGFWQLANQGLTGGQLKSLDRTLTVLFGKVGEAFSFEELTGFYQNRVMLKVLEKEGYESLGVAQLRSLLASEIGPAYLREMNEVFDQKLAPAELLALREANLFATGIRRLQRDGYNDLSVAEYIRLHTEPETTRGELREVQMLIVGEDFGRKRKKWRSSKLELTPFDKLVVEDDIRVVVIPGDRDQAEMVKVNMKGVSVDLRVNGNGTLTIRKKMKLGWAVKGFVVAEIRLAASQLERIEVKDPARVFLVGDPSAYIVKGKLGSAELE